MTFPEIYDEDDRVPAQAQRDALVNMGVRLDGEPFLVLMQTTAPLNETVLCCGVPPHVLFDATGRRTGVNLAALQVGEVTVVRYEVVLYDDPERPWSISCLANPHAKDMREMLTLLADQGTLSIMFYDEDVFPLKGRIFQHDPDMRTSLRQMLADTEGITITQEAWDRAVAAINRAGM